jgi:hypothetical protein
MPSFQALHWKTVALHVGVGMGAASFWRGAWYVLDDHLFPDEPGRSSLASLGLGTLGMATSQGLMHRCEQFASKLQQQQEQQETTKQSQQHQSQQQSIRSTSKTLSANHHRRGHHQRQLFLLRVARFGALYTVALSVVLVWRGTWIGWDVLYEHFHNHTNLLGPPPTVSQQSSLPDALSVSTPIPTPPLHQHSVSMVKSTDPGHLTQSGIASHVAAVCILLGAGLFASVLAPPAAISVLRDAAVHSAAASTTKTVTTTTAAAVKTVPISSLGETYEGPATNVLSAFLSSHGLSSVSSSAFPPFHHVTTSTNSLTRPWNNSIMATTTTSSRNTPPLFGARATPSTTTKPMPITSFPPLATSHLTETMKHRARMYSTTKPQSTIHHGND